MKIRIKEPDKQPETNWSGGKTRELGIFPEGSSYLDRDFIWRLSTASSDREESSFSRLEGFDRILMVIEGDVVLSHGQDRSVHLRSMEQDSFDGGIKTKCFGELKEDYNLIMARGCKGNIRAFEPADDGVDLADAADPDEKLPVSWYRTYGIYCLEGYVLINCDEESRMIRPKTQAMIDLEPGEDPQIKIMGEGRCIVASVAFGAGEKEAAPEAKTPERDREEDQTFGTSFGANYGICLRLFAKSNRWSKMMRREGADRQYYDRELSKALAKLERRYTTALIWAGGCILCFIPTVFSGSAGLSIGLAAAFTIIHLFFTAPFIYWLKLPKPVGVHIKSTDEMDAFEKIHHREEISKDPHFERVMSKYASDDENYFTDERSVFYRLVKKKK